MDTIHVYAFPEGSSGGIFLGAATYGVNRSDIGAIFGARFAPSGFTLSAPPLTPGRYTVVAYARSTVTGDFTISQSAFVSTNVQMSIDSPAPGVTTGQPFTIAGWALDQASAGSQGIDAIHVYAYPVGGGTPVMVGNVAPGVARPDLAAVYGSQFLNCGWGVSASGLAPGTYDLVVYAHRAATGQFEQPHVRRVIVQ